MKTTFATVAAICLPLAVQPSLAAGDPGVAAIVDPIANPAVMGGHCAGLAIGVDQGSVFSENFYGKSGTKRPLDGKTEFEIQSITKTFTALVLALASQRAKAPMSLQDPLQKYAPAGIKLPTFDGTPIRLVDLATHTAGLPRKDDGVTQLSVARVWSDTAKIKLATAPGSKFLYSNLGFGLLGLAEEADQKQPLQQIFEREITGPLAMSDTRMAMSADQLARKAQGHHPNGSNAANSDVVDRPGVVGAFALNSTLDDMMKYLAFQMGAGSAPLLPAALLSQMPIRPRGANSQIGLAWNTDHLKDGTLMIDKDGAGPGFTAYIAFTPSTRVGVVVLANQLSCPVPQISFAILSGLNKVAADAGIFLGDDDPDNGE